MEIISDVKKCTGCMACYSVCKQQAISMQSNDKGFWYPVIDESKCTKCGRCQRICPIDNRETNISQLEVYAAWAKNKKIRKTSTSGGLFPILAETTLRNKGVVFGAQWKSDFSGVEHTHIFEEKDLILLQGSKYVQSFIQNTYIEARKFLEEGREVLFSGTPCQIAGLKNYLHRDYDNLITVDLVCHGVPSPRVFNDYRQALEVRYQSKVKSISLRYKKPSWLSSSVRFVFQNNDIYESPVQKDAYFNCFVDNLILRECCYQCQFANLNRVSDNYYC